MGGTLLQEDISVLHWVDDSRLCTGFTVHTSVLFLMNVSAIDINPHIWVVLPRTGKMSNICHNFFLGSFTVAKRFDFLKFRQLF